MVGGSHGRLRGCSRASPLSWPVTTVWTRSALAFLVQQTLLVREKEEAEAVEAGRVGGVGGDSGLDRGAHRGGD